MAPGKVASAGELESHHLIEDSDEHAVPDAGKLAFVRFTITCFSLRVNGMTYPS
jgi:hypothetical protein